MPIPSMLETAVEAAQLAGALLRENYETELTVGAMARHDIKLDLDVRCQEAISEVLLGQYPDHEILGEEGNAGTAGSEYQWIVDPLDGTVNYFYGIPHFCVSVALRRRGELLLGVIFDPMLSELFTVMKGDRPLRNGRVISASRRAELAEAVITVGFSKTTRSIEQGGARFISLAHRVRKTRILGSAALAMAYVACGRLDAYIEESISIWDVAAGIVLVESAGGSVTLTPHAESPSHFSIVATNGLLNQLVSG